MIIALKRVKTPSEHVTYFAEQVELNMPNEPLVNIISLYSILSHYPISWVKEFFKYYSKTQDIYKSLELMNNDAVKTVKELYKDNPRAIAPFPVPVYFQEV